MIKPVLFPNIAIWLFTNNLIFINKFLNHYIQNKVSVKISVSVFGVINIIILVLSTFPRCKTPK